MPLAAAHEHRASERERAASETVAEDSAIHRLRRREGPDCSNDLVARVKSSAPGGARGARHARRRAGVRSKTMHPAEDILMDTAPLAAAPPPPASVIRYKSGAPVDELLYRMAVGDVDAALDAAQELFDAGYVPVLVLVPLGISDVALGYHEMLLLSSVDGCTPLAGVLEDTGLAMVDALRALCELLEHDFIKVC
jgi:hypothetical protein